MKKLSKYGLTHGVVTRGHKKVGAIPEGAPAGKYSIEVGKWAYLGDSVVKKGVFARLRGLKMPKAPVLRNASPRRTRHTPEARRETQWRLEKPIGGDEMPIQLNGAGGLVEYEGHRGG